MQYSYKAKHIIVISTIFCLGLFLISACAKSDSHFANDVANISAQFLDTPYHLDPLGEGNVSDTNIGQGIHKDSDPLYRTDVFDCLTYVETVLAHAKVQKLFSTTNTHPTTKDFINAMNKIRYQNGTVSFVNRTHFQYPDWVNNNSDILSIATDDIAYSTGITPATSTINLCRGNWFKQTHNIDIKDDSCEQVSLNYLPLSKILNHTSQLSEIIAKPYIFMTVISDDTLPQKIGTEYNISHTGFILPHNDGKLYLRHASKIRGKVTDSNMVSYIKSLQKNKKYLGFALLKINI